MAPQLDVMSAPSPESPGSCSVCGAPQRRLGDFCFSCGTRFTCPNCQYRYLPSELLHATLCPQCGISRDLPEPMTKGGAKVLTVVVPVEEPPVTQPLGDLLRQHLAAAQDSAPVVAASVRDALLGLAEALRSTGRLVEAVVVLDDALEEEGMHPSSLVHLYRAEVARERGDEEAAVRAALWAASIDPERLVDIIERGAVEITTATAQAIESLLQENVNDESLAGRSPRVQCAARFLAAGAALARQDTELALAEIAEAVAVGQADSLRLWRLIAQRPEVAQGLLPGGEVGAATFLARGYALVGDDENARSIARSVIDQSLSGPGNPEAECRLILAEDTNLDAETRAAHLAEAGRLVGQRGGADNLRRSIELLNSSAQLDDTRAEAFWYAADNQRLLAFDGARIDADVLRQGLETWERGAAGGSIRDSWPRIIESALCVGLADAAPDEAAWPNRAVAAAVEAVALDPGWSAGWTWLSRAVRRHRLWDASWWASRQLIAACGPDGPTERDDVEELVFVSRALDEASYGAWLDKLAEGTEPDDWLLQMQATRLAWSGDWDGARACLDQMQDQSSIESLGARQWSAAMFDDPSADVAFTGLEALWAVEDGEGRVVDHSDRAWGLLTAGRPEDALHHLDALAAETPPALASKANWAELRTLAALLMGDAREAEAQWLDVQRYRQDDIRADLRLELPWAARRCRDRGDDRCADLAEQLYASLEATSDPRDDHPTRMAEAVVREAEQQMVEVIGTGPNIEGLVALRGLAAMYAVPRLVDTREWPSVSAIELGAALVPIDAETKWENWILFRDLIPQCRSRLESALGFPVMAIDVVVSNQLASTEFRPAVNGFPGPVGSVESVGDEPGRVHDHLTGDPWLPALAAFESMVLSRPEEVFVPFTIEQLVGGWRQDPFVPAGTVAEVESDRFTRVVVWQRLREVVEQLGRLPTWSDQTGPVVEAAIEEAQRTVKLFSDPGPASVGELR